MNDFGMIRLAEIRRREVDEEIRKMRLARRALRETERADRGAPWPVLLGRLLCAWGQALQTRFGRRSSRNYC